MVPAFMCQQPGSSHSRSLGSISPLFLALLTNMFADSRMPDKGSHPTPCPTSPPHPPGNLLARSARAMGSCSAWTTAAASGWDESKDPSTKGSSTPCLHQEKVLELTLGASLLPECSYDSSERSKSKLMHGQAICHDKLPQGMSSSFPRSRGSSSTCSLCSYSELLSEQEN